MSKYVSRIMDEVYYNFSNHFDNDQDEQVWFLEELIEELQQELKFIKND
tara:strand:- start:317 stop:463 length:147 start_codon:yes stop_codon:yes gene_type:complete